MVYHWGAAEQGHGKVERGSPKAKRGHRWSHRKKVGTFTHTERASVSTFNLSDRIDQNIKGICYAYAYMHGHTYIYIYAHLHVPRYTNNK